MSDNIKAALELNDKDFAVEQAQKALAEIQKVQNIVESSLTQTIKDFESQNNE